MNGLIVRRIVVVVAFAAILAGAFLYEGQGRSKADYSQYGQYYQQNRDEWGASAVPSWCVPQELITLEAGNKDATSILHFGVDRYNWMVSFIGDFTSGLPTVFNAHPSIAPNGCWEVWAGIEQSDSNSVLWVHQIDGNNPFKLQNNGKAILGSEPDWGYLGEIVYVSPDGEIHITDLSGNVKSLDFKGKSPVWSPDGKKIAYISEDGNLVMVQRDSLVNEVTNIKCGNPTWSADGSVLYCRKDGLYAITISNSNYVSAFYVSWADQLISDPAGTDAALLAESESGLRAIWLKGEGLGVSGLNLTEAIRIMNPVKTIGFQSYLNPDWWTIIK